MKPQNKAAAIILGLLVLLIAVISMSQAIKQHERHLQEAHAASTPSSTSTTTVTSTLAVAPPKLTPITPVPAPPGVKPPKQGPQSYTVKAGDTLWNISKAFSGDPTWYKDIVSASWVKNPDLIFPGQVLTIPAIP